MNGLPSWVESALLIDGVSDEAKSKVLDLKNPTLASVASLKGFVKLGLLTQEKGLPRWGSLANHSWSTRDLTPYAGFTCDECPQRERAYSDTWRVYPKDGSPYDVTQTYHTQRCTECGRKMRRWVRAQRDARQAQIASECYEQDISFVTLTLPNMAGDVLSNVRLLKRKIASFRRRFPVDKISGGWDYYEWTYHPDDRAWSNPLVANVHMHGVWVMDFWNQKDFQDRWGEGIVHVKRLKKAKHATRYATKYATKSDVKGIRLKEGFGCLYGRARRAMLQAYAVRQADES